jgi:peptidoglycan/LPS O-acetylase OafA/YrhL
MKHSPDLDGLHGVAVLPVILFHAGVPGFPGGYVGVDLSFVISRYLITSILLAELAKGTFTFQRFCERGARRILPARFVVVFTWIPFAWVWMGPDDLEEFSCGVVAV